MDSVIRINSGEKILSYSWAGVKTNDISYPDGQKSLKMKAHVSSSMGYFAWLSDNDYLLMAETLTGDYTWVDLKDPLFKAGDR